MLSVPCVAGDARSVKQQLSLLIPDDKAVLAEFCPQFVEFADALASLTEGEEDESTREPAVAPHPSRQGDGSEEADLTETLTIALLSLDPPELSQGLASIRELVREVLLCVATCLNWVDGAQGVSRVC